MPYTVTLTRGSIFANIADGTINQTSTMTLIGRDFANYGQFVDQDFIRLLESGAATANNRPTSALTGQLWFDLTNTQLKVATVGNIPNGASYTGNPITWQGVSPSYSASAPTQPRIGDTWMYTDANADIAQLVVYNGDPSKIYGANAVGWQAVGPLTAADIVTVDEISGNIGNFNSVVVSQDFTAEEGVFTDALFVASTNASAFLNVGGLGIFGSLNGPQPNITSLGACVGGLLSSVVVGNDTNPGTRTIIDGNGINTGQGVVAQGISYLSQVTGVSAVFNVMGAASTTLAGNISAVSKYQPNIRGLGIQEQAFDGSGQPIAGAGLAVSRAIIPAGGVGNATVDIGANTANGFFGAVYANVFVGQLQGSLTGNIPAASITEVTVPSDGGIYVGGAANAETKTGVIRIDGGNGTGSFNNGVYIGNPNPANTGLGNIALVQSWGTSTIPGGIGDILTLTNAHKASNNGGVLFDIYRDVRIQGNLYVLGTTVETQVDVITTDDKTITIANNVTNGNIVNANGAGIEIGANGTMTLLTSISPTGSLGADAQRWVFNRSVEINSTNTPGNSLGDLKVAGNILASAVGANSQFSSAAVQNLFITGTGGRVTGQVNGALGAMLLPSGAVGNAVGLTDGTVTYPFSLAAVANTAPARDRNGDIFAVNFQGTATMARYADLAENYLADRTYSPGTLVTVGGDAEITECGANDYPLGVVSTNPAYLMNTELVNGTPIALRGRVPVRIKGAVNKGDRIGPSDTPGVCARNNSTPVAIALHNAYAEPGTESIVEAVIL